ncbi:heptosyltransferase-2 [Thermoflavifilum aggregans]|uniref:Heptosyltransferase-2 n=1 Tax=Thermoflavifilum aggregans TaxID=454188 RepID=A0A2M9CXA1_9BACT|nr:glycosyltransferase family 9 protein [Thermoflavifilum aggregans]PJJ76523.1 heptosyltransferase-2 [Thermoflavifilum aggregans]
MRKLTINPTNQRKGERALFLSFVGIVKTCLIIQTAFLGDVVLATAIVEELHAAHPDWQLDFLLRKGNESLLAQHPFIRKVWVWDKKHKKYSHWWQLCKQIRRARYDVVINVQRFFSTGLLTVLSGAGCTIGFDKNPLSFLFDHAVPHLMGAGIHETDRNHALAACVTQWKQTFKPRLYLPPEAQQRVAHWQQQGSYCCLAPASVWFTKQWPREKWLELLNRFPPGYRVYLLGSASDRDLCQWLKEHTTYPAVDNLAGELNPLESAALMAGARMNFVNDSAPLHLASAVNAPTAAVFCSTVPEFGYGPLADVHFIIQTTEKLPCRPCGLHGHKACPEKHFRCAWTIPVEALLQTLDA